MQSISYPDGLIETQLYTGTENRAILAAMDNDLHKAKARGGRLAHRGKIGRNTSCPCGSGIKFKKCCMAGARVIGTI